MFYLVNKSEGCNILGIYMKQLNGEIVDIIKKREDNIRKERRRFVRENKEYLLEMIFNSLMGIIKPVLKDRNIINLGIERNKYRYDGKGKEILEKYNCICDVIEEEDIKECLIMYLKHIEIFLYVEDWKCIRRFSQLSYCSSCFLF